MVIWSLRYFLYSSSVYSCRLFLISSASARFIPLLSFIVPIFAWNVPSVSVIFLTRSLVFRILLFSSISLHWSLRKAFLSLSAILWNSAFRWVYLSFSPLPFVSLLSSAICKASLDNLLAFLHFFFSEMVLITAFCIMSRFSPGPRQHLLAVCYLLGCLNNGKSDRLYFLGFQNHCAFQLIIWWRPCVESSLVLLEEGVC